MYITQYFFDHKAFQHEAVPLMHRADVGDYQPVLDRARAIADSIPTRGWILEGQGTDLLELQRMTPPAQVGFAFLVLLSQYLAPYSNDNTDTDLSRQVVAFYEMAYAAEYLGWDKRDIQLLKEGMATTVLLKCAAKAGTGS